jgi:integrase
MLVFKKPKTQSSIRRVWLPETVARMLVDWKKQQEEQKMHLGSEYHDYNIVLALPNGRPMEGQVISRLFNALIRKNDLPKVVFHSLRHSSTTYKLKLNNGDMKAVQGDTGHAQLKMVSDVYSHILDEDRRHNAEKMERDFYKKAENQSLVAPEAKPSNAATEQLVNLLNASPELAAQLLQMLTANQAGQAATA